MVTLDAFDKHLTTCQFKRPVGDFPNAVNFVVRTPERSLVRQIVPFVVHRQGTNLHAGIHWHDMHISETMRILGNELMTSRQAQHLP